MAWAANKPFPVFTIFLVHIMFICAMIRVFLVWRQGHTHSPNFTSKKIISSNLILNIVHILCVTSPHSCIPFIFHKEYLHCLFIESENDIMGLHRYIWRILQQTKRNYVNKWKIRNGRSEMRKGTMKKKDQIWLFSWGFFSVSGKRTNVQVMGFIKA